MTSCPSVQWASVFLGSFGRATKTVWTKVYGALCHRDEPTPPLSSLLDQRMAHRPPLFCLKKEKEHTWKKDRKGGPIRITFIVKGKNEHLALFLRECQWPHSNQTVFAVHNKEGGEEERWFDDSSSSSSSSFLDANKPPIFPLTEAKV